jgi:hypothetical protein
LNRDILYPVPHQPGEKEGDKSSTIPKDGIAENTKIMAISDKEGIEEGYIV